MAEIGKNLRRLLRRGIIMISGKIGHWWTGDILRVSCRCDWTLPMEEALLDNLLHAKDRGFQVDTVGKPADFRCGGGFMWRISPYNELE
jgi:hypothetical protein